MKKGKKLGLEVMATILFLMISSLALAEDLMILVTSPEDLKKVQPWVDFLTKNEITVKHFSPGDFEPLKKNFYYVTILGGMDQGGIRKLIAEAVGPAEAIALADKGTQKMVFKENVWLPGQKVLIFTGDNSQSAVQARTENRETWMKYLKEWFTLGEGPSGLKSY
ncbi:MAG: hypothetical protein HY879_17115 [Deltaproteobacteria bacterium]|nr:hypothetical protein [Deltaproteobacteria bacterium]